LKKIIDEYIKNNEKKIEETFNNNENWEEIGKSKIKEKIQKIQKELLFTDNYLKYIEASDVLRWLKKDLKERIKLKIIDFINLYWKFYKKEFRNLEEKDIKSLLEIVKNIKKN